MEKLPIPPPRGEDREYYPVDSLAESYRRTHRIPSTIPVERVRGWWGHYGGRAGERGVSEETSSFTEDPCGPQAAWCFRFGAEPDAAYRHRVGTWWRRLGWDVQRQVLQATGCKDPDAGGSTLAIVAELNRIAARQEGGE